MTFSRQGSITLLAFVCLLSSLYYFVQIAPLALKSVGSAILPDLDLYASWYGAREVLHGRNPYSPEATAAIQTAVYGTTVGPEYDSQRFSYPVFYALVCLPLWLLSFAEACKLALVLFLTSAGVAVRCWLESWSNFLAAFLFLGASFPFLYAVRALQPTLLFLGLLSIAVWAVRSHRHVLAGITLALATCKPHLAIAVVLPLAIWGACNLHTRKGLLLSFAAALSALFVFSETLLPAWLPLWLASLRAYTHNRGTTPLMTDVLTHGATLTGPVSGILFVAALAVVAFIAWNRRREEPALAICFSIAVFQLVIPFRPYDLVLQVGPLLWLAAHRAEIKAAGWAPGLALAAVWVSLAECFISTFFLSILHLFSPAFAVQIGLFPIASIGVLPFTTLTAFAVFLWNDLPPAEGQSATAVATHNKVLGDTTAPNMSLVQPNRPSPNLTV